MGDLAKKGAKRFQILHLLQSSKKEDIPALEDTNVIRKGFGVIKGFSCSSYKMKTFKKDRPNYCKSVIDIDTQER